MSSKPGDDDRENALGNSQNSFPEYSIRLPGSSGPLVCRNRPLQHAVNQDPGFQWSITGTFSRSQRTWTSNGAVRAAFGWKGYEKDTNLFAKKRAAGKVSAKSLQFRQPQSPPLFRLWALARPGHPLRKNKRLEKETRTVDEIPASCRRQPSSQRGSILTSLTRRAGETFFGASNTAKSVQKSRGGREQETLGSPWLVIKVACGLAGGRGLASPEECESGAPQTLTITRGRVFVAHRMRSSGLFYFACQPPLQTVDRVKAGNRWKSSQNSQPVQRPEDLLHAQKSMTRLEACPETLVVVCNRPASVTPAATVRGIGQSG